MAKKKHPFTAANEAMVNAVVKTGKMYALVDILADIAEEMKVSEPWSRLFYRQDPYEKASKDLRKIARYLSLHDL